MRKFNLGVLYSYPPPFPRYALITPQQAASYIKVPKIILTLYPFSKRSQSSESQNYISLHIQPLSRGQLSKLQNLTSLHIQPLSSGQSSESQNCTSLRSSLYQVASCQSPKTTLRSIFSLNQEASYQSPKTIPRPLYPTSTVAYQRPKTTPRPNIWPNIRLPQLHLTRYPAPGHPPPGPWSPPGPPPPPFPPPGPWSSPGPCVLSHSSNNFVISLECNRNFLRALSLGGIFAVLWQRGKLIRSPPKLASHVTIPHGLIGLATALRTLTSGQKDVILGIRFKGEVTKRCHGNAVVLDQRIRNARHSVSRKRQHAQPRLAVAGRDGTLRLAFAVFVHDGWAFCTGARVHEGGERSLVAQRARLAEAAPAEQWVELTLERLGEKRVQERIADTVEGEEEHQEDFGLRQVERVLAKRRQESKRRDRRPADEIRSDKNRHPLGNLRVVALRAPAVHVTRSHRHHHEHLDVHASHAQEHHPVDHQQRSHVHQGRRGGHVEGQADGHFLVAVHSDQWKGRHE